MMNFPLLSPDNGEKTVQENQDNYRRENTYLDLVGNLLIMKRLNLKMKKKKKIKN